MDTPGSHFAGAALSASKRMNGDRDAIVEAVAGHIDRTLPDKIAEGVSDAMREILADKALMALVWKQAYEQLSENASTGVKLWIGGRVLVIFLGAAFTAVMAWLYSRGAFR